MVRLVLSAAKKFFGRFDAALNAANLAVAHQVEVERQSGLNPEPLPTLRELAKRQRQRRQADVGADS